jgi:hypothetical protein
MLVYSNCKKLRIYSPSYAPDTVLAQVLAHFTCFAATAKASGASTIIVSDVNEDDVDFARDLLGCSILCQKLKRPPWTKLRCSSRRYVFIRARMLS